MTRSNKQFPNLKVKYGIATVVHGIEYAQKVARGIMSKADYCNDYGYELFVEQETLDPDRHPSWWKILHAKAVLPYVDWLFVSDADVIITNPMIELPSILMPYLDADIVLPREPASVGFNCGNFFLRNTPWVFAFLDYWYTKTEFLEATWWEQSAFIEMWMNNEMDVRKHTMLSYGAKDFNACWPYSGCSPQVMWEPGDFLMHVSGGGNLFDTLMNLDYNSIKFVIKRNVVDVLYDLKKK